MILRHIISLSWTVVKPNAVAKLRDDYWQKYVANKCYACLMRALQPAGIKWEERQCHENFAKVECHKSFASDCIAVVHLSYYVHSVFDAT